MNRTHYTSDTDWGGILIAVFIAFLVASPYLIMAWRNA